MGSDTHAEPARIPDGEAPVAMLATSEAILLHWRQVFPGEERRLAMLRHWLLSLLPECAARDDVISVATELASNAIRHTASGQNGRFGVEISRHPLILRVAVADSGGPGEPRVIDDLTAEHGRGLLLVHGLSVRTGVVGDQRGRLVWADIAFDHPEAAFFGQAPYEATIRDEQAALTRRFAEVPVWFGRSTLAWWALVGPGDLISAPSAGELADRLSRIRKCSYGRGTAVAVGGRRPATRLAPGSSPSMMLVSRCGRRPPKREPPRPAREALDDELAGPLAVDLGVPAAQSARRDGNA